MKPTHSAAEYGGPHDQAIRLGISRTTFYRLSKHPLFPRPINALAGRSLYRNAEVDQALVAIDQERQAQREVAA